MPQVPAPHSKVPHGVKPNQCQVDDRLDGKRITPSGLLARSILVLPGYWTFSHISAWELPAELLLSENYAVRLGFEVISSEQALVTKVYFSPQPKNYKLRVSGLE